MIYGPQDALDVDRFLSEVLPGAVPQLDPPGSFTARAIYERFLAASGLRLVPRIVVRETLRKALTDGKIVVRFSSDGRVYDAKGCVEGPVGQRRRTSEKVTGLPLSDEVLVTTTGSEAAKAWLKEDDIPAPTVGSGPTSSATPSGLSSTAKRWPGGRERVGPDSGGCDDPPLAFAESDSAFSLGR